MAESAKQPETNEPDMRELREEFTYAQNEKREIREEGATDIRYLSGKCMDEKTRTAREDANRPLIEPDELSQYVNQLVNGIRQNKRSIRAAPRSSRATKNTAEFSQNKIRQIEYESNAQQAYSVMAENAFQRSYGYLRILPVLEPTSMDWELRIRGIPNPDLVTEDPADGRTDGTDWQFLWFREAWTRAKFKKKFPKATIADFSELAHVSGASEWVNAATIHVAERWFIDPRQRKLLQIRPALDPTRPGVIPMPFTRFEDELKKRPLPQGAEVLRDRMVDYPYVKKQVTNGLEILEEQEFPVTTIPFVACYGKILYVEEGGTAKKKILSLIRLARDPQQLYAYYRTQQAEMAAMIPKTPIGGYKGQFEGLEGDYQRLPHEPLAFIEFGFTAEGWPLATHGPMPPPTRLGVSQADHMQALEMCAEGARRAIQAAIGIAPLPTQAQRRNEKSGVALQQIESSEQRGSFHFVDHYDDALVRTGKILDEWMPVYYDTLRETTTRNVEDQPVQVRINDPQDPESITLQDWDHDITISVGPYEASERDAASNFADTLIGSPIMRFMPPELALKVMGMAVRLKAVGPIGDQIADLLSPKQDDKQQGPTPQQVQQMQSQIQQLTQQLQEAARKLETDEAQNRAKVEIEQIKAEMQITLQTMKDATSIQVAEIAAKTKGIELGHDAAHEAVALHTELAHDAAEADKQRAHEAGLQAMGAVQGQQASDQGHAQALEQGDQGHQQAIEQAANQAALQPPPEPSV